MIKYYTTINCHDGFGSQYQKIIQTYIFCKINSLNFLYNPISKVEHNYDNDENYINKLESLINLKENITNVNEENDVKKIDFGSVVMPFFEKNIDLCCETEYMKFIKNCYWENKDKKFFNNNKFNVSIHIRRQNYMDRGLAGDRATTPNSYYLNIMNLIRQKYKDKEIIFHVYSQGDINNFTDLSDNDVMFYINHDIIETFKGLVSAEALVTSPSSLSYVAGLLSDGEVYYKKFWHNPKKEWIVCN
jgi:hypothetical protein